MLDRTLKKQIKEFGKGDYVKVSWFDANDDVGRLEDHKKPQVLVWEWGVFLGCEGSPKHIVLGKSYIPDDRVWAATRIPLMLIQSAELVAKSNSRRIFLRRYIVRALKNAVVQVREFA